MILVIDPYSRDRAITIVREISEAARVHVFWGSWNTPFFMDMPEYEPIYNTICDLRENGIEFESRLGRERRANDIAANPFLESA